MNIRVGTEQACRNPSADADYRRLRVKDLDFAQRQIIVRDAKGVDALSEASLSS